LVLKFWLDACLRNFKAKLYRIPLSFVLYIKIPLKIHSRHKLPKELKNTVTIIIVILVINEIERISFDFQEQGWIINEKGMKRFIHASFKPKSRMSILPGESKVPPYFSPFTLIFKSLQFFKWGWAIACMFSLNLGVQILTKFLKKNSLQ